MSRRSALVVFLTLLSLSACSAPQPQPLLSPVSQVRAQDVTTQVELKPQAMILNHAQDQPLSVLPEQLIFDGQHRFEPGQVLMGRSQEGQAFLRQVVSVQTRGPQTVVQTQQAYLTDAFDELDVTGAVPTERMKPIELDRRTFKIGFVSLDSALKAQPDFSDARLRIHDGKALYVRLAPQLELTWDVTGRTSFSSLESGLSDVPLKPIGNVNFKTFPINAQIGPVPVTFYIRPGAALDWGYRGSGSIELGAQLQGRVKAGVELNANLSETPDVNTLFDYGYDGHFNDPRIDFDGQVRTRLHIPRIRVESEIAEMTGPYIEAESFIDGDLDAHLKVVNNQKQVTGTAEAHLGLALRAGLPATHLFGKQLTQEINKTLFDRRIKELYKKQLSYTLPVQ